MTRSSASSAPSSRRSQRWTSAKRVSCMAPSTDEPLSRLLSGVEQELPRAVELRHRLHASPELAHAEEQTAAAVEAELPVACARGAGTGRIARVGAAAGGPVAVRAELDGLPIQEQTDAPFRA